MEEKRKRGRPTKPQEEKNNWHPLHIYFPSEETVDLVRRAAEHEGQALSAWARSVLLREARQVLGSNE